MTNDIECQVMKNNRHQFICGYSGQERTNFLRNMANHYPIILNQDTMMGIYVEDFTLPQLDKEINLDETMLEIIGREYLNFSIAYQLIYTLRKQIDMSSLDYEVNNFLKIVNRFFLNKAFTPISNFSSLETELLKMKERYKDIYAHLQQKGVMPVPFQGLSIPYLDITFFVKYLKQTLHNNASFAIFLDTDEFLSDLSTKAINELLTKRINKDISLKVASDLSTWKTFSDFNGVRVDYLHDCDIVQFDDSINKFLIKKKNH